MQIPKTKATIMADDYEDNDFEEEFQEADEPDDLNEDVEAGEGDQEAQIDIISPDDADKKKITER